jgi:hypothetical protein
MIRTGRCTFPDWSALDLILGDNALAENTTSGEPGSRLRRIAPYLARNLGVLGENEVVFKRSKINPRFAAELNSPITKNFFKKGGDSRRICILLRADTLL